MCHMTESHRYKAKFGLFANGDFGIGDFNYTQCRVSVYDWRYM